MKRGKDNKAVVASNIMYIVGQYPRFLKAHWKFLKTVVNKLFEFMHETHEGVQDMACDTFIKIASKCKRHFVITQPGESEAFIDEIVRTMRKITCDLSPQQVHTFYEACGHMISAQGHKNTQERLIAELMGPANAAWDQIIQTAAQNSSSLRDPDVIKFVGNIMKTNVAACSSIGPYFSSQIGRIWRDMLTMYRSASELINESVKSQGEIATKMPQVRGLRTIKKEILKLVTTFVDKAEDLEMIQRDLVPELLDAILMDYKQNVPDAREAEVLAVVTVLITKLQVRWTQHTSKFMQVRDPVWIPKLIDWRHPDKSPQGMMTDQVPAILDAVFECTLGMITKDLTEYPDHRVEFYKMLRAINQRCFPALLQLDDHHFKLIVDSCMWAWKHDNRAVENEGLNMCVELISNMAETPQQTCDDFFRRFYMSILQDVFFVLTDSDHKAGFKYQSMLLARMFWLVGAGKITAPIYTADDAPANSISNKDFLQQKVGSLLSTAFPNLQASQISTFLQKLFASTEDMVNFKLVLRDFLVSLKEFSGDNAEMFAEDREVEAKRKVEEEMARKKGIAGMIKPSEIEDDEL